MANLLDFKQFGHICEDMEAQSNLIPESASIRYARVWADFSAAVECGEAKTLSSYCRLTHTRACFA